MKTATTVCGRCGAKIPADATREVCPACLLETGLGPFDDDDENGVDQKLMPRRNHGARPVKILSDFGDYELLEEVGRGGQGAVYRAHQKSLNRTVALKVIGLGPWTTQAHVKRFRREAEAAASLDHPCIVPIYEVGERDGQCYFSMKFVEGAQLDEAVSRETVSIRRAAELIAKLARTVHYAHEHGILHRDIKPGNILLDAKGEPHLTDFGLARLVETESTITGTLEVMGTPSYMAPEQAAGETRKLSNATDIYGLGAVLYQLLTGHPPFAGATSYQTIRLLLDTEPRQPRLLNPKIDRELSTICLKCLEKDPTRRYSSALALAEDLEHWLKHEPIRAKPSGFFIHTRKWVRRNPSIAVLVALLVAVAMGLTLMVWDRESAGSVAKSIAVLPFENLSHDPDNAYFADGVQDDILTSLARIADLKVIGRISVTQYKSGEARDLRKIGHELGVANVLEGSVQRSGNRVRVNAHLVDARSHRELWGQSYDRDIADVFAIQSEIAMAIAEQLHTKLLPNEKNEIERPTTSDIAALNLYARAGNLLLTSFSSAARAKFLEAVDLLNQAVARDPSFLQAYCRLAYTHDMLYFLGLDHTPSRLALAEAAVESAFRLRPDAGETHLARAENLYRGHLDYDGALAELELARRSLPNYPQLFALKGYIKRRQGHWEESTDDLERSIDLDPRNFYTLLQIGLSYGMLHRYGEAKSVFERALDVEPNDVATKVALAAVQFHWKADTQPLHQTVDSIRATNPAELPNVADDWLSCVLAERDPAAAKDALDAFGDTPLTDYTIHLNRALMEGVLARMVKDDDKARLAFTAARAQQEKIVEAQPNYGPALCVLGLIDAALGRKGEALREGRRAVELVPADREAISAPLMVKYLAMIAAWVGDKDLACQQLAIAVRPPSTVSYGQLKLLPYWDSLRGYPRFEQIVASLAPEVTATSMPDKSIAGQPETSAAAEESIAVLPFANLSQEPDSAYFVDGIREQIAARLAKISNLQVVSGSSVHRYDPNVENVAQIAAELNVTNLLRGTVHKEGDRFLITARLIDATKNAELWAQAYDRTFSEVIQVESDVARQTASALGVKLTEPERRAIDKTVTSSPRAYEAYLKGRYVWLQRKLDGYRQAKEYFEQAISLDPNYAQAYAGLADAYQFLAGLDPHNRKENFNKAKSEYKRALELDPTLAEAHASAGLIAMNYDWDWALAEQELRSAIALDPNAALFYDWYAEYLMAVGRASDSVANMERARELDPFSMIINSDLGKQLYYARQYDEAEAQLKETLQMDPDFAEAHRYLGGVYVIKHRFDDAIAEFKMAETNGNRDPGLMTYACGMAGRNTEAERMLEAVKKFAARRGDIDKFSLALAYIGLGEKDRAIACLEQEYENHGSGMTSLKSNPEYDSLRSDPRFVDLMRRVHLAPK